MSLLREIQEAIVDPDKSLGPILLKVRLLADRLGSDQLEEWVKYESEGYPPDIEVPDYRRVEVSYVGNFANIAWRYENQQIPPALIKKYAGAAWNPIPMRESISAIDQLLRSTQDGGTLTIDASNLILILQDKIMDGMQCHAVSGRISLTAVREIESTVRARILELTMRLEKEVPGASEVTIGKSLAPKVDTADKVEQVVNMTVYGSNTVITGTGSHANITISNAQGDLDAVTSELMKVGIPEPAAKEFAQIVACERPESKEQPFGDHAREWLSKHINKALDGTWKIGIGVATKVFEEVALRYYGLK
jgi:hypothetical protein